MSFLAKSTSTPSVSYCPCMLCRITNMTDTCQSGLELFNMLAKPHHDSMLKLVEFDAVLGGPDVWGCCFPGRVFLPSGPIPRGTDRKAIHMRHGLSRSVLDRRLCRKPRHRDESGRQQWLPGARFGLQRRRLAHLYRRGHHPVTAWRHRPISHILATVSPTATSPSSSIEHSMPRNRRFSC